MAKKINNTGDISLSTSLDGLFEQPKKGLFYDDKGNKVEREYYQGPNGTFFTYDKNYNAVPLLMFDQMSPQELEKWRTTAPNSPYKKGMKEVQTRQAMMRAAGLNVPDNGLWDDTQQAAWNKLTTKSKDYDTTLMDLAQATYDKATGNDTYKDNPLIQEAVKTYDSNNVDWYKSNIANNRTYKTLAETYGPIVAAAMAPTFLAKAGILGYDLATSTRIGQAILPYADAVVTSGFGAKGLTDLANGNANWETALDVMPLAQVAKPMYKAARSSFDLGRSVFGEKSESSYAITANG